MKIKLALRNRMKTNILLLIGFLLGISRANAQTVADPACSVYVHLQFPHLYGEIVQKLEDQGFHLVQNKEDAVFSVGNAECAESGCALTEAYMFRKDSEYSQEIIEVRGWDYIQLLFSRAIVANRITKKLVEALPTCELAKTMDRLYIDTEQVQEGKRLP